MRILFRSWVAFLAVLFFSCSSSKTFSNSSEGAQKHEVEKKPVDIDGKPSPEVAGRDTGLSDADKAKFQERVEFPSTREMFEALGKLSTVDWKSIIPPEGDAHYSSKTLRALNLGTRVADGFAAANAKDVSKLEQIAQSIDVLSGDMGIPRD